MSVLIKGHQEFKNKIFKDYEQEFIRLVKDGQSPKVLFISCSDSRVVPDLIMNTNPGDLFIIRNVGNFIPPYSLNEDFHGTASAIEYAVEVLKVSEIIICGHTHCGACATLHKLDSVQHLPHLKKWLEIGKPAKNKAIQTHKKGDKLLRETEKQSLINQIENLLSYPNVLKKVENGDLHIHGWLYHIENGAIKYFDSETEEFLPLDKLLEK